MFEAKEIFGINNKLFDEIGNPRFMDENYYKKHHFKFTKKLETQNRSRHSCMFPNCNNESIKYSHTIPLNGVLSFLAKSDTHLFTPIFNLYTNSYEFKKKGINRASTFPGFCTEHENMFTFENNNNFYDISIHLQNYRAILRDLFYLKSRHKLLKKEFDRYHKELFNYHDSLIKTHAGITIKKDINLTSVEDPNMNDIKQKIHYIEAKILVLDNDFLSGYHIQNDKKNMINTFIIEIDECILVALAGQSNLQHKNKKGRKSSFPVYLSIFPSSNKTVFIYSLKNRYKSKMDELMLSVNHPLKYLSFIESWLIYGSDTWFINESYLNSFSKIKKNKILSDLYDLNKYPTDYLEYSLFDELRVKLLKSEKNIDSKLFKIENRKLSYFTD